MCFMCVYFWALLNFFFLHVGFIIDNVSRLTSLLYSYLTVLFTRIKSPFAHPICVYPIEVKSTWSLIYKLKVISN